MDSNSDSLPGPKTGPQKETDTPGYAGMNRRVSQVSKADTTAINAIVRPQGPERSVWDWQPTTPRRRADDPAVDILKCLDVGGLTLVEDERPEEPPPRQGFDPYGRS
jgi:hypothetical protein